MRSGSRAKGFARVGLAAALSLTALLAGCASPPDGPLQWHGERRLDGAPLHVTVRHADEEAARTAITAALDAAEAVHAKLRSRGAGSEIDLLGKVPSHLWVEVSRTTFDALALGASIAEASGGAYDYTWPPLQKPWGLRPGDTPRTPRQLEIDSALRRVDWEDVEHRDEDGPEARRLTRRTEIELGALARGLALDAATDQLRALGIVAGRADTGSLHAFFGGTPSHPWRIRLQGLHGLAQDAKVPLRDGALAVAERGPPLATPEGGVVRRRLDPRTGRPVANLWALVVAARAGEAAGWADALLVLGSEGKALVSARPELEAAFAPEAGPVWTSPGLPSSIAPD